jgi:hypothetical protein
MPQMSFDLMDGKPKVSFPLKQDDVDRFVQFMNDCNGYMKQRDELLHALKRLEEKGWLKHILEMAKSVDPAKVSIEIKETVSIARHAIAKAEAKK